MSVFIDTSAFFAILDADDANHSSAGQTWLSLLARNEVLVSNNYVLVETLSLMQRRLGMDAVRIFQEKTAPVISIDWIDALAHQFAINALLIAGRRQLSLVDCSSFETMRRLGIRTAFAFDPHFAEQGFECVP